MSSFSKLIITNAGKELLNTSFTTGKKIVFTNAVTSAEKHTIDDLKGLSELQAVQCVSLKNVNVEENHIKISIGFNNGDLMEGYLLQTLGVYAKLEDSTEVLFAASKEETENAYIPSKDVTASGISIKLSIYLENAENVKVNIDPAGVATMGDVLSVENSLSAHINDAMKHITPTERNAWNQTYEQGTAYTDQKIADLINGAPETLDTLKEVADAIQENETIVEALDAAIGNKANRSELDTHIENETIHITASERNKWNSVISNLANNYYDKTACEEYYYKKSDVDLKFDESFIHNTVELKAGRPIYLYPSRLTGYKLISASTNNSASYVKMFALGDNVDTIELSAIPEKDCKLYLTYVKCLY